MRRPVPRASYELQDPLHRNSRCADAVRLVCSIDSHSRSSRREARATDLLTSSYRSQGNTVPASSRLQTHLYNRSHGGRVHSCLCLFHSHMSYDRRTTSTLMIANDQITTAARKFRFTPQWSQKPIALSSRCMSNQQGAGR